MTNSLADIVVKATPGPWSVCHHLKSVEHDAACPCGYRGVVWGPELDVAMAVCQPGHDRPWREEEWGSEPARYPRDIEIANAQLIALAPTLATLVLEAREALQKWLVYDGHDAEAFSGVGPMLDYAEAIEATRATLAKLESL